MAFVTFAFPRAFNFRGIPAVDLTLRFSLLLEDQTPQAFRDRPLKYPYR
jgi:hypothetical protein